MVFVKIIDFVFNVVFPPKCCVCGTIGDDAFCQKCVSQIKYIPHTAGTTASVAVYDGVIKKAIKKLKFNKKKQLAPVLSKIMLNNARITDFDAIIPVPLHKTRSKVRGFNQSELLAKDISVFYKMPILTDILVRVKNTSPQFGLKKGERHANIQGAFAVTGADKITGKKILLIDDILTTGATLNECKNELLSAGAERVMAYTLSKAE